MRILAIGDIHTKSWIIEEVEKIADNYDAVVFCGDYADDWGTGPSHSMSTWRLLKMLMDSNPKVKAVLGNHDYAYIHKEISGVSSGYHPVTQQLLNAPENKKIKDWLLSLPVVIELDGITFSHAGVTDEWNGEFDVHSLWQDNSPIWTRPEKFGGHFNYKNIPQVIGHNPSETCEELVPNVWCIDTFSTYQDGTPVGDQTVLEIINGKFNKIKLKEKNEHNDSPANIETNVS